MIVEYLKLNRVFVSNKGYEVIASDRKASHPFKLQEIVRLLMFLVKAYEGTFGSVL